MREITTHKVDALNEKLAVAAMDDTDNHMFSIAQGDLNDDSPLKLLCTIRFQNGPVNEVGVNGITFETLIAIMVDRLEHFQRGPYACNENAEAIFGLKLSVRWLGERTKQREARQVEGTSAI